MGSSWNGSFCEASAGTVISVAPVSCIIPDGQSTCGPLIVTWANATSPSSIKYTYTNPGPGTSYNGTTTISSAVSGSVGQSIRYGGNNIFWNDTGSGSSATFFVTGNCAVGSIWDGVICQPAGATGSITSIVPANCSIPAGNASCNVQVSWTTVGASNPVLEIPSASPGSVYAPIGSNETFTLPHGTYVVTLRDVNLGIDFDTDSVTAACAAGSAWNGSICVAAPTVDLKIDGSDGPLSLPGGNMTLSWTTSGASSCTAAGPGWSGARPTSSAGETIPAFTGTYTLTCTNGSVNGTDSVDVTLSCTPSCTEWTPCGQPCSGGDGTQSRTCTTATCLITPQTQSCSTDTCRDLNWKEIGQ